MQHTSPHINENISSPKACLQTASLITHETDNRSIATTRRIRAQQNTPDLSQDTEVHIQRISTVAEFFFQHKRPSANEA